MLLWYHAANASAKKTKHSAWIFRIEKNRLADPFLSEKIFENNLR